MYTCSLLWNLNWFKNLLQQTLGGSVYTGINQICIGFDKPGSLEKNMYHTIFIVSQKLCTSNSEIL